MIINQQPNNKQLNVHLAIDYNHNKTVMNKHHRA